MVVVGVKNLNDVLSQVLLLNRLQILTSVEGVQVEGVDRLRIPDAQGIYHIVSVTHDRHVIRNRTDGLIALLAEVLSAVITDLHGNVTAEFYFTRVLGAADLKRVAVL